MPRIDPAFARGYGVCAHLFNHFPLVLQYILHYSIPIMDPVSPTPTAQTPVELFRSTIAAIGAAEASGEAKSIIAERTKEAVDIFRASSVEAPAGSPDYTEQLGVYQGHMERMFYATPVHTLHRLLVGVALENTNLERDPRNLMATEDLAKMTVLAAQMQEEKPQEIVSAVVNMANRFKGRQRTWVYETAFSHAEDATLQRALLGVELHKDRLESLPGSFGPVTGIMNWTELASSMQKLEGKALEDARINALVEIRARCEDPVAIEVALGELTRESCLYKGLLLERFNETLERAAGPELATVRADIAQTERDRTALTQQQAALSSRLAEQQQSMRGCFQAAARKFLAQRAKPAEVAAQTPAGPGAGQP